MLNLVPDLVIHEGVLHKNLDISNGLYDLDDVELLLDPLLASVIESLENGLLAEAEDGEEAAHDP
jgi:hypothetical protein